MANQLIDVIGLPPVMSDEEDIMTNSIPTLEITPAIPKLQNGPSVFGLNFKGGLDEYKKILKDHKVIFDGRSLKLAFLADNFPTDTFANEYGESFLQKMTDVASESLTQISQMTGRKDASKAVEDIFGQVAGADLGIASTAASAGQSAIQQLNKGLSGLKQKGGFIGGAATIADEVLAGGRLDFPSLWTNSSYQPSYTITVRLYNPNPASDESTQRFIYEPLVAILALGLPRSGNTGNTFTWPFFHRIHAPGLYTLNPSMITNITVIKGGDQQQIAWNQRLGVLDLRIDFGSLYNSIVINNQSNPSRPTLKTYAEALTGKRKTKDIYKKNKELIAAAGTAAEEDLLGEDYGKNTNSVDKNYDDDPPSRTNQSDQDKQDAHTDALDSFYTA